MACMYERSGTWWVKWYDPPRHPNFKSLGTSDKKEARALLKEIEAREVRGRHIVLPGNRPFGEILDEFLRDKKGRREAWTWKSYEKYAVQFRKYLPLQLRIGSIEAAHIANYLDKRVADGLQPQSVNKERATLVTVFNWAIRRDYAERNPAAKIEPYSVRPKERPDIGKEDFENLCKALEAEVVAPIGEKYVAELLRDAVVTIWWSGLRIGEVCRLRPEDLDLKNGQYVVRSAVNKGPRLVPMHPEVEAIFRRRLSFTKNLVYGVEDGSDAYNSLKQAWQRFVYRHPEFKSCAFHALRHAFNTRMQNVIDNPLIAMRAMGHKTIEMSSHYTRVGIDKIREAFRRLA